MMKALYKGEPADIWEIGKTTPQPDWVREAFEANYLYWLDNHLRILMSGLKPSLDTNLKIGAVGTIGGGCMESEVQHQCLRLLREENEKSRIVCADMTVSQAEDEGMVCGGTIDVFLEKFE